MGALGVVINTALDGELAFNNFKPKHNGHTISGPDGLQLCWPWWDAGSADRPIWAPPWSGDLAMHRGAAMGLIDPVGFRGL